MVEGSRRQFRLGRCLGRGGFGEVYLATMRSPGGLDTIVAVKILRDDLRMDPGAVRRLRDEGRMLSRVRHPSLVHVFDLTRLDGRVGLVTEYVEGDDLEGCLRPPDPISHRAVIQAIGIVAAGLAMAVTTRGADGEPLEIVHRDVKPSNIRIGRHGQVKLLDFGIARFTGTERESETVSDVVVGSVPYVAPERLCERSSLPAGDVFGLGCCLFEGIAGEPLHLDRSLRAVSALYLDADRYEAWLADRLDRLRLPDPTLRALVGGMLAHDPSRRPEAGEVARTCEVLGEVSSGPGLRRWGGDRRTWPAVGVPGPLEGLTLIEGELSIDEVETDEDGPKLIPIGPIDGPKRIHRPLGTLDPREPAEGDAQQSVDGAARDGAGLDGAGLDGAGLDGSGEATPPELPAGGAWVDAPPVLVTSDSTARVRVTTGPDVGPSTTGTGSVRGVAAGVGCTAIVAVAVAIAIALGAVAAWVGFG